MNGSIDGQSGLDLIQGLWPRLQPDDRAALLRLASSAAGASAPASPRRRHRHFSPGEIQGLKLRLAAMLAESPSLPNRALALQLGVPLSTFKVLGLHRWARITLQSMATAPRSAVNGYGAECAADETGGPGDGDD